MQSHSEEMNGNHVSYDEQPSPDKRDFRAKQVEFVFIYPSPAHGIIMNIVSLGCLFLLAYANVVLLGSILIYHLLIGFLFLAWGFSHARSSEYVTKTTWAGLDQTVADLKKKHGYRS